MNTRITAVATTTLAAALGTAGTASAMDITVRNADRPLLEKHRQLSFGGGATYQNYKERVDGSTLDKETGWMPNIEASASWLFDSGIFLGADVSYSWSDTDYDGGQTNLKTGVHYPYKGHTSNDIVDVQARVGYAFSPFHRMLITPYATYGHRYWDRDLGNPEEKYNSNHVGGGIMLDYAINEDMVASLDAMGATTFSNDMKAKDKSGIWGNSSHTLGDRFMGRVRLGLDYRLEDHWFLYGGATYTHFSFGKSSKQTQSRDYVDALGRQRSQARSVYEPKSQTHNINLDIGVRYTF